VRLPDFLRRYGDLVLAGALATLYLAELVATHGSIEHVVVVGAAGAGAALSLTFRRRTPLASFVLCMALLGVVAYVSPAFSNDSYAVIAMILFSLYSLGANARGIEAWLGLGGLVAAIVVLARGDGDYTAGGIAFYCALCGLPWGTGTAIRLRIDRVTELEARNAALREEAQRAVAEERGRIARELHDVVSHAIAVTVLQARGGQRMIGREEAAVRRSLDAIEATNTAALADMRRLLALLRDSGAETYGSRDEPAPSLERLDHLLHQVRESGLPVELGITGEVMPLPPGLDLSAYRIVQEALTNVLTHAGPQARARVELVYGADALVVEVTNSGRVPPARSSAGQGLIGIRERVGVAGGSVQAGPVTGGYAVRARLPYLSDLAARPQTLQVP
jgi:signal transduction histidine kinase